MQLNSGSVEDKRQRKRQRFTQIETSRVEGQAKQSFNSVFLKADVLNIVKKKSHSRS